MDREPEACERRGQLAPVSLAGSLERFSDHWHPRVVTSSNGQQVKVAKILGAFDWHSHAVDELFLVVKGAFVMETEEGGDVTRQHVREGELFVVPRGVRHRPVADAECHIALIEPSGVVNTGDAVSDKTRAHPDEWI